MVGLGGITDDPVRSEVPSVVSPEHPVPARPVWTCGLNLVGSRSLGEAAGSEAGGVKDADKRIHVPKRPGFHHVREGQSLGKK